MASYGCISSHPNAYPTYAYAQVWSKDSSSAVFTPTTLKDAFQAMADPTRRAILDLLRKRSRTSGEIAERFDSAWPTVSRHLAILKDAGLIAAKRNGQFVKYQLRTKAFEEVMEQVASWTRGDKKK